MFTNLNFWIFILFVISFMAIFLLIVRFMFWYEHKKKKKWCIWWNDNYKRSKNKI